MGKENAYDRYKETRCQERREGSEESRPEGGDEVAITKATKRRPFPYERVLRMWKAGKTLETIARAVGRYEKNADDPLRSFRVSLTRFHKGVKLDGRLVKLPRVGHASDGGWELGDRCNCSSVQLRYN